MLTFEDKKAPLLASLSESAEETARRINQTVGSVASSGSDAATQKCEVVTFQVNVYK